MISFRIFCYAFIFCLVAACSGGGEEKQGTQETVDQSETKSAEEHAKPNSKILRLPASQFEKMRSAGVELNVIDVRTPKEVAKGKIPGSMEIDYEGSDFEEKVGALDKLKTYVVYCEAGGRGSKAAEFMVQNGFKSVYNLEGGYKAWENEVSK